MALIARSAEDNSPATPSVGHVGTVGKMMNVEGCRVVFKTPIDSVWGASMLYKFWTPQGQTLVAFYSGDKFSAEVNDEVNLRFKVKKHDYYNGESQTLVSHLKRMGDGSIGGGTTQVHTDPEWMEMTKFDEEVGF